MSYISMVRQSWPPPKGWKTEEHDAPSAFEKMKKAVAVKSGSSCDFETITDDNSPADIGSRRPISTAPPGIAANTFEDYKLRIYSIISEYKKDSSQNGNNVFVGMSEECLLAMQNDKEYESWVLEEIQKAYATPSVNGYETHTFLSFGATKETFRQESYSFPDRRTRERLRKISQAQKDALKKKRKKLMEKKRMEEKWQKQAWQSAYIQLKIQDHRMQLKEMQKAFLSGETFQMADHDSTLRAAAKRKVMAYESTFQYKGSL